MQTCVQTFSFYCTQVVLRQLKRCCKQVVLQHLKAVRKEYNINVYNGFLEQTTRLLFVPDANFWDREFEGQKVWIKTVKPNGVIEATKKLGAGDGIFTFVNSLNMQTGVETMENPYCFEREDGTKAVVQLWKKSVNQGLENHFDMRIVDESECADFRTVLVNLFGHATVQKGKLYYCKAKRQTANEDLAIQGKWRSIRTLLNASFLLGQMYFNTLLIEKDGMLGIRGYFGVCQGELDMFENGEEEVVLYIRHATKTHACIQPCEQFFADGRRPKLF